VGERQPREGESLARERKKGNKTKKERVESYKISGGGGRAEKKKKEKTPPRY